MHTPSVAEKRHSYYCIVSDYRLAAAALHTACSTVHTTLCALYNSGLRGVSLIGAFLAHLEHLKILTDQGLLQDLVYDFVMSHGKRRVA